MTLSLLTTRVDGCRRLYRWRAVHIGYGLKLVKDAWLAEDGRDTDSERRIFNHFHRRMDKLIGARR